jgi:hypothetical protein
MKHDASIRLEASPSTLQKSGEWVTVLTLFVVVFLFLLIIKNSAIGSQSGVLEWSGVAPAGDWIGVYSSADVNVSATVPTKYKYADEVQSPCKRVLMSPSIILFLSTILLISLILGICSRLTT